VRVLDSRRLTGPSLQLDGPGAILDVALEGVDPERAIAAWRAELGPLLAGLGWADSPVSARVHKQGLSLAFGAPPDVLYAATEVNEQAWRAAALRLERLPETGEDGPRHATDEAGERDQALETLRAAIERERKPELLALSAEARRRGVALLADDRRVSVGLGSGSRVWPTGETAEAAPRIPWAEIHDVPVALVTGTNGKTTTVRLLGAIVRAAGLAPGVTSTDFVTVGEEVVAEGDYSGPNGARTVLRDRRVEMAILEVARGGILRRGLAIPRAQAALVTNVADDHLGEFGIFDVPALADVKMVVAKAVGPGGRVVLNADDPLLLERGARLDSPVCWFTLDAAHPAVAAHLARGGEACLLDGEALVMARGAERRVIAAVRDVPMTLGGAARHNVANALAAIGVAGALGLTVEAIAGGLRAFENNPALNPGRANLWRLGGVTAIVDFAHNPHGMTALVEMVRLLPARRRGVVIGQAGDRDDDAIRAFVGCAWALRPQHVFVKEMEVYLRGRERGVVPEIIERELIRLGAAPAGVTRHESELEAVQAALRWASEGDLLLLTTHAQRDDVIELLTRLVATGWTPGSELAGATAGERTGGSEPA
jgi:UDP-N-acetylmuramyl tripeptide synthase